MVITLDCTQSDPCFKKSKLVTRAEGLQHDKSLVLPTCKTRPRYWNPVFKRERVPNPSRKRFHNVFFRLIQVILKTASLHFHSRISRPPHSSLGVPGNILPRVSGSLSEAVQFGPRNGVQWLHEVTENLTEWTSARTQRGGNDGDIRQRELTAKAKRRIRFQPG